MTPLVLWNEHIITCSSALFKGILTAILKTLDEYLNNVLWMKAIHYPNKIRSPLAPFTPKSN